MPFHFAISHAANNIAEIADDVSIHFGMPVEGFRYYHLVEHFIIRFRQV